MTPPTERSAAEELLSVLKATMARSEQDRKFGPAACRTECLRLISEALDKPWRCWCGQPFSGFTEMNAHLAEKGHLRL